MIMKWKCSLTLLVVSVFSGMTFATKRNVIRRRGRSNTTLTALVAMARREKATARQRQH